MGYSTWTHNTNQAIARSFVGRWFKLDGSGHRRERKGTYFFTEIRAGLASFFAMAYIISVNATIISDSGGTCVCPPDSSDLCATDTDYMLCVSEVHRDLITATAAICALASFSMGLFANMPLCLAPGMGMNAYFTYTVVGYHGSGSVPYGIAVTAVFVEGMVFIALTILGLRQWLARIIPSSLKVATGVGVGLYLTIIGLGYSAGLGLITGAQSTPLELAGCAPEYRDDFGLCPGSQKMRNPTLWLGIFCGGILTVLLMLYRIKGAVIIGVLLVSIVSWPRGTPVSYFGDDEISDDRFDFFKRVVAFHPIEKILTAQQWDLGDHGAQFGLAFITFLYVDLIDATAVLYSMARFCGVFDHETQDFEGSAVAYIVDGAASSIGSLFGTSPVVAYIESGVGISEGGATGLTAITCGLCFFVSIFFAPIFASIPPYATGAVLVFVGCLMLKSIVDINWKYLGDAVPAFLTIVLMPFTFSIAYGVIAGVFSYMAINGTVWVIAKVSRGKVRPPSIEDKEFWTHKVPGGLLPPWLVRLAKGKKDFWRSGDEGLPRHSEDASQTAGETVITGKEAEGDGASPAGVESLESREQGDDKRS
ncbi:hypothetical protein ACJ41O_006266 [Fusarium nematophilum]